MVWSLTRARHPGVWSHWVLGSITRNKANGGERIPAKLFQILNEDAVKVLHSICQQIWKIQQWSQDWKRSVFIPIPKKGNAKECTDYRTIALISHASKVMLKILQARLLICKDPDAGKDWRREEKEMTEDAMVGGHHWLNGHKLEQTLKDNEGQGSVVCCSS